MFKSTFQKVLHISSPIFITEFDFNVFLVLLFVIIEKIGMHELAISNIIRACYMIMMTPVWGFAESACNSMVSNLIGQQKQEEEVFTDQKNYYRSSSGMILFQ